MKTKTRLLKVVFVFLLVLVTKQAFSEKVEKRNRNLILFSETGEGSRKERSRSEIIRDMLSVTMEERKPKKTRIMQKTCLNLKSFRRYFEKMLEEGFISQINSGSGRYEVTEKGRDLLNKLKEMDELMPNMNGNFRNY